MDRHERRMHLLRQTLLWLAAWLMLAPATLPAQKSVPNADSVIAVPVVNMYRGPSADSDVISQSLYGTGVLILDKQPQWYRIQTADGYKGWVPASGLKLLDHGPYAPEGKAVRVAGLTANLYREADVTRHAPVLELPWESRLEVIAQDPAQGGRWLQVRLVNGESAWVQRGDISSDFAPLGVDDMLRLAHRFLGITYTWGGVSTWGFDCSGFTQMLVRQRGIEMPRDADVQAAWSGVVPVRRDQLRPGDLLFFGGSADRITHTGMYIGNGEFIHDTTHDHPGVQISRLDDMPWTKLLVAERRLK